MRKKLEYSQKIEMESALRSVMSGYSKIEDPVLRAKVRSKVQKAMNEFDVLPFGYRGLPEYMKE